MVKNETRTLLIPPTASAARPTRSRLSLMKVRPKQWKIKFYELFVMKYWKKTVFVVQ